MDAALIVAGITLIGLALRLPSLDDALFADELSTNFIAYGFGVDNVIDIVRSDQEVTPPLSFLLVWLTKGLGGVEALRLPALLAGLAAIPLTYLLGLRTVGRRAATVAAAFMALSPFQIFYSTEARSYTVAMLFGLLACLAMLKAIESGRTRWWVAFALAAAAAAYAHYTAIFLLVALFGWAFVSRPEARKPLLLASLGAAALFAPWLPEYIRDGDTPNGAKLVEALHPLTFANVRTDLVHWSFGHPYTPVADMPGNVAIGMIGAALVAGTAGLLARVGGLRALWPPPSAIVLVVLLACAVPAGALLYNLVGGAGSVFGPRYLIVSWPALALTVAALVSAGRGALGIAGIALLLGGSAIGAVRLIDADQQRPDLAAATRFIEERGEPGSPVVDVPQPSPGPQTNLESAFAPTGEPLPREREILALGLADFDARLGVRGLGGLSNIAPLPTPTGAQVARRAARRAGSGPLFLVSGDSSLAELRAATGTPAAEFLAALPPRFQEVESRTFPGFWIFPVTVHVLESEPAPGA